nr:response regulator [Desulfobulbaceae bacterium]
MNSPLMCPAHSHDIRVPATILIVDDELINRKLLTALFEIDNYFLLEAENGIEALRLAVEERPDIILLDIIMPQMDGYAVCEALKSNPQTSSIPIVLVTAHKSSEHESKGFLCGAVDYIHKPFNPAIVKARVVTHLKVKLNQDTLDNSNAKLQLVNKLLEQEIEQRSKVEKDLVIARDEVESANRLKEAVIKDLFLAMCEMLSSRDLYTFEHGMRVASISRLIGEEMGLGHDELDALELGCMLHDISKVAIPDDVLLKPGLFDAQDREIMRLHPAMGARIFSRQSCDQRIIDIIHYHHERLDGSGYPAGLKSDEISLLVRIAMVADTYEAMVAKRPYKKPISRASALRLLKKDVGAGLLDRFVVEVLAQVTEDWSPLNQIPYTSDEGTKLLELFRQKTYFREPLSDFYNYRYLFFLERSGFLDCLDHGYSLFKIEVTNLNQINKDFGYLKIDQIIDNVGSKINEVLLSITHGHEIRCQLILMRKGSTYLVYTNCHGKALVKVDKQLENCVGAIRIEHGVLCKKVHNKFLADVSVEEALYKLLAI